MGISRQVFPCPVTTTQNHILKMSKLLFALAFIAMVAAAYAESCANCEADIIADVSACKDVVGSKAIVTCVMDVLKTSADCVTCVCTIVADVFKLDFAMCA